MIQYIIPIASLVIIFVHAGVECPTNSVHCQVLAGYGSGKIDEG